MSTIREITADESHGPAMRALLPRQRRFVEFMLEHPSASATDGARGAGYDQEIGALQVTGYRMMHNDRILDAMTEEAKKRLRSGAIIGASVLVEIATDPTHKDRLKAASTLLNRIGLHEKTEHEVVTRRPTDEVEIKQRIVALAKELGIDPQKLLGANTTLPAPIEGEFTIVESSTAGLEDVL